MRKSEAVDVIYTAISKTYEDDVRTDLKNVAGAIINGDFDKTVEPFSSNTYYISNPYNSRERAEIEVKVKKLRKSATVPSHSHKGDAGYDLYACIDSAVAVLLGETAAIPTGISIEPPGGYFGAIFARSGLATKQGLRPANCVGVCDSPYRGEYIVAIHNDSSEPQLIAPGQRIAQLIILPFADAEFKIADELGDTDRGSGGFGSTGA